MVLHDRTKEHRAQTRRRSDANTFVHALQRILGTSSFSCATRLKGVVAALVEEHKVLKAYAFEKGRVPVRVKDPSRIVLRRLH